MQILKLTSPIPPSVNHYLGYRGVMRNGKPTAMSYVKQAAADYKETFSAYVREEVRRQGWTLEPDRHRHFYIDTVFYFDKTVRDPNNYYKLTLDAITDTGLIWPDDNVTCERVQRIYYDPEHPRVELTIRPVDYIGIFDNAEQLERFLSKCVGCTRHSVNCSVLRKAKEGRIQKEIDGTECLVRKERKAKK